MQLEEWIIGATYSLKERGGTVTLLGKLVNKHCVDGQVALDFRKEDGQEHIYFVEEGVEYIANSLPSLPPPEGGGVLPGASRLLASHISPQAAEATQNTAAPLTLADPI
jgi:hypothetical protein